MSSQIEIVNTDEVQKMLNALSERMEDMSPVMADVSDIVYHSTTDNFLAGGRPRWDRLRPGTIQSREKDGYWPGSILARTGDLKNSVLPFFGKDYAGAGTTKKSAKTHQFGAKKGAYGRFSVSQQVREHIRHSRSGKESRVRQHQRTREISVPWGDVPARPFFSFSDNDMERVEDVIKEWMV
ncbi:MAG: hypothetical protein GY749_46085 [Desulfobacteraceae bacterium]|nr:hypothetical protein [Desulfobacteraceae bacterium]